jgi:hypothetical protein
MMSPGIAMGVAALAGLLAAEPAGMYLPAAETGGAEFQFNPASPDLRAAVKARTPRPDDLLDARALADDLVFLRRALRKQYIGYPELLQRPDFDVEALFDQHIARLRAGPAKVKFADSAMALFLELKRHINDGHFGMRGVDLDPRKSYVEYQAAVSGPAPSLAGCTVPQASPTTLRLVPLLAADGKQGQLVTVSARPQGDTLELACNDKRISLTARPLVSREDGMWDKPVYEWRRAGSAAIIRIRRFGGPPAQLALLEQLVKDYPQHRRAPVIVFDLRGNGGGNDGYAYDWIDQAKRGAWSSGQWALYPAGSFIPWLEWNQEVWAAIDQDRVDDPASVAKREDIRKRWPASAAELLPQLKALPRQSEAKQPYKGRIFVLVDRLAGSSGESSAMALRAALGARLVGERTGGFQEYGNVRILALPRTRLALNFATKRNYFQQPAEAVGQPVDVYLPPELMAKPVEELLPLLNKLPRERTPARSAQGAGS